MSKTKKRAMALRERLELRHLNVEAGHFALLGESNLKVTLDGESLTASNVIYLMLDEDEPVNYLQWLASDDIQILIEGGPADYYLFMEDGSTQKITMGRDLDAGHQLIVHAPACTAKAIVLHEDTDYLLVGSVVTPAWSPTRARIGGDQAFIDRYTGRETWATEAMLLKLIGPNFGETTGGDHEQLELYVQTDGEILFQGMQLSVSQAASELARFAFRHPDRQVTLGYAPDAPAETVNDIRLMVDEHGLDLVTLATNEDL